MDKNAIKKFAVWARRELIARISQKAVQYGIEENSMVDGSAAAIGEKLLSNEQIKQRQALIAQIKEKGYPQVMEEVAYTWFNRFIALRFMEVNNYLPSHVRVFTDEDDNFKPQIITEAIHLELDGLDMEKVYALKEANQTEELYRYLLITQCNALNQILPKMFQKISDYTELLFPDNLLREGSVLQQMIEMIPEEDWQDTVQIIGWLYQYYNAEKKDEVFAALKKNVKITKENIPAATQLFTPDWIVRYMVENSLGRLWLEHLSATGEGYHYSYGADGECNAAAYVNADKISALKGNWKYYLDEAPQEPEVQAQLAVIRKEYAAMTPEQIKCIDPCCGSGHILAYLFDVLVQIYESYGYTTREAVASIVQNNLYGLDIDDRAAQLAYFAVMMKARQYDRRFFSKGLDPHIYAIQESNTINRTQLKYFGAGLSDLEKNQADVQICSLLDTFQDAKEFGSILQVEQYNWELLYRFIFSCDYSGQMDFDAVGLEETKNKLFELVQIGATLAQKYDVVCTNPPYMAVTNSSVVLNRYVTGYFPVSKADLFSVFIERCGQLAKAYRYYSMITQQSWLSLPSFLEMRKSIFSKCTLVNMAQLGSRSFNEISGEVVSAVSFVFRNVYIKESIGHYSNLQSGNSEEEKEHQFLSGKFLFAAKQDTFKLIPNNIVVYDATENSLKKFNTAPPLKEYVIAKPGMQTSDNERFLRLWHEIAYSRIGFGFTHEKAANSEFKWFPYNKGIGFRKWYGNNDYVVNFYHDGEELKYWLVHNPKDPGTKHWSRNMRNYDYYFCDGITFTAIGNSFSARLNGAGYLFDTKGPMMFGSEIHIIGGFVNSVVFDYYNRMLCKQITKSADSVNLVPFILPQEQKYTEVENAVDLAMNLSKKDWDSFEASWDFEIHPLVRLKDNMKFTATNGNRKTVSYFLQGAYRMWENECEQRFNQLKANEEELNRIFIEIYGLQDELTPEVEDKDVTVRKADLTRDIKSLISYAVGCMFGRYSLDRNGLVYAGGTFEDFYQRDSLATENGDVLILGDISLGVSESYTQVKVGDQWVDCRFPVDKDNIIPIYDDPDYSENDLANQFVMWIKTVYGKDTLDENLKFIANALDGKGQPKEIIRNYFLNDFYADHCKIYQKRPIYWLFDSGKKNGFKALIYMHRYQPDTIARIRTDYVHEQQARYRTAIADLENRIANASTSERVKLSKALTKLQDQDAELRSYEEKIHHLADQMIAIDLDDGVKVNYAKFQDVLAKIK